MQEGKDYTIEAKKEILKSHLDTLRGVISAKFEFLSTISGLVAALLVIATFNETLFEMTSFVKVLIAALLTLIPLSLLFRLIELTMGEESVLEGIDKVTGLDSKKIIEEKRKERGKFYSAISTVVGYSPFIIFAIFTFIVIAIIYLIFT